MSDLISFKNNWKDGNVTHLQLEQIWKNYSKETQLKLVSILEKFEVAFRIKGEDKIVIPSLLTMGRPVQFEVKYSRHLRNSRRMCGQAMRGMEVTKLVEFTHFLSFPWDFLLN
jgi:hypothetical protein